MLPLNISRHRILGLLALAGAGGSLLLFGCMTPAEDGRNPAATVDGIRILEGMGYSRDEIEEKSQGYIVQGDMYFSKQDLARQAALGKTAQRKSTAVSNPAPNTLTLAIHSSVSDYTAIINQAVNIWNNAKTRLHIEIVTSNANITVYSDASSSCPANLRNQPAHVGAIAYVAGSGNPGSAICVNKDGTMMDNDLTRTMALAHEIGHTIGFRHTNSTDGTHITGTATSDPASIMGTSGNTTNVLSHNDILGLEILYPSDKPLGGSNLDGDTKDDVVVWRPSDGYWHILKSSNNFTQSKSVQWGLRGDMPMEDTDIDGDGKDDMVVWRPSNGTWYVLKSNTNYTGWVSYQWGLIGDVPMPNHDMDGDGKDDLVVWRWTNGTFYVRTSSSNYASTASYQWGLLGDIPVSGLDVDKDGKDDWVVWRATDSRFYVRFSASNFTTSTWYSWGQAGDIPVGSNDLDLDGKDDLVIWRPATGVWWARTSSSNFSSSTTKYWGLRGNVPLMGTDIDQDGKRDVTVWHPIARTFYFMHSSTNFGTSSSYVWGL